MQDRQNVQINTPRIPVGSSIGSLGLIAVVLTGLFLDLPGVRGTVVVGGTVGLILATALIWRRRQKAGDPPHPTLGITVR